MLHNQHFDRIKQELKAIINNEDADEEVVMWASDMLRNLRMGIDVMQDEIDRMRIEKYLQPTDGDYGVIGWLPDDFDGEGDEDDEDPDADGEDAA